jgi:hypothetical protein
LRVRGRDSCERASSDGGAAITIESLPVADLFWRRTTCPDSARAATLADSICGTPLRQTQRSIIQTASPILVFLDRGGRFENTDGIALVDIGAFADAPPPDPRGVNIAAISTALRGCRRSS